MASSVPVVLCGKSPTLATTFIAALGAIGPEVDVVHVCHDLDSGRREIPALLRGDPVTPESGRGSNAEPGHHRTPKAIVVGKGFSDEEVEALRATEGATKVPWLLPDDAQMTWMRIAKVAGTAGAALPAVVAQRVVDCLKEHGMVPGKEGEKVKEGAEDGAVWGF